MEATLNNQQDSRCTPYWVSIAVLFVLTHSCSVSSGQSVTPDIPAHSIQHSLTKDAQEFPATRWDISNRVFSRGCIVQWTIAPFVNESNPASKADSDVAVRLIRSGRSSRWTTTQEFDNTNFVAGKEKATVVVTSSRRGNAVAELLIRFRTPRLTELTAGKYHTTLTGTISGL